ncbi:MAG: GGDEF domain-containing phosphodiesterase [Longicatena sp.]
MKRGICTLPYYLESEEFYVRARKLIDKSTKEHIKYYLVSFDFDNFNYINDLFSYETGDLVLTKMMEHFSLHLQNDEIFSRFHADHFTFLLKRTTQKAMMKRFATITDLKDIMIDILPIHYSLVSSSGIVCVCDDKESVASYLDKANFARKLAKGTQVNEILFYDNKMEEEIKWRKAITLMMESALINNEFKMYLQPKLLINTNQIIGSEALVRWENPKLGMIFPDRFIPIFEQNGFIKQIDFYMLEQACIFIDNSIENGIVPLPISVNFSKVHVYNKGFVPHIYEIVHQHNIDPEMIEIEFTENVYLQDFEEIVKITKALKELGFKVALDDFGSAYSSLNCLKELAIDVIKIDKAFLSTSANSERGRLIITKVVELIKSLHMISVMEGVETQEQLDFLKDMGCDIGQGYLYSKAISANEYIAFVKNGNPIQDLKKYLSH